MPEVEDVYDDGDTIAEGTVEVGYIIRIYDVGQDAPVYDFISGPIESEQWYDSIEEATEAAKRALDY